jgi:ABC-type multidrug transport system fused ATPase/permease subunit
LPPPEGNWGAVGGPRGAANTTLVHLLLRFWEYNGGHLLWDGCELRHLGQEDLRRQVAVVSQRTYLFNATVRDNLLLALPPASGDGSLPAVPHATHPGENAEAEMIEAARKAQIHEFIRSLPEGYDTWIGEQGLQLSAGQRQRLALARAILRDAPLLILDEPTANLDALTERKVMASLRALMAGRTTLLITHRLVGLEAADEILVLREGRIVERGRHHELLQMGGVYYRMWELQKQMLYLRVGI